MSSQLTTRREFISLATAAAATAMLPRIAHAEPPVKIGFGFSLYGMKSLKVQEALKACAEIGYSGVELACLVDWPCDPVLLKKDDRKSIRELLEDQALDLPCLMDNLVLLGTEQQHKNNLERLKLVSELGHDLVPDAAPIVETVLGGKPTEWMDVRNQMVTRLQDWAQVGAAHQTVIAIKAHAFGALHTPKDAKWLVDQVKSRWIRLVFDYSHFQRQQFTLEESLAEMLADTVFIHVKDNLKNGDKLEFALPGDAGDIDYARYLSLLKEGKYQGAVVVEVSGQVFNKPGYDPIGAAKHCYSKLQPAFVKAGLRIEV